MWCPNCGNEVVNESSFCMHCGCDLRPYRQAFQAVSGSASAAIPTPTPAPVSTPEPKHATTSFSQSGFTSTSGSSSSSSPSRSSRPSSSSSSFSSDPKESSRAVRHAKEFMRLLDSKGMSYEYKHEKRDDNLYGVVCIPLGGGGLDFPELRFYVDFDFNNTGEGDSVHITVYTIASYSESRIGAAYEAINEVANKKRFVRFYLDSDNDLTADCDTWVNDENCTDRSYELLMTMASVINATYSDLQRARWS